MKILLPLLVLIGASFTYGDECYKGQAYWCTNLKVAKSCGAVQHCIDNVWSQQKPYAEDAGDVCKFCEDFITDVRNLFSKGNEAKVQKYLDSACGMIPVPELSDKCKDYVKNDLDEVYQLIRSKLDPKAICSAMQLCTSYKDLTHVGLSNGVENVIAVKALQDNAVLKTTTAKVDLCQDCEKLINDMKSLFTNKDTESQVESYLKKNLCQNLGPASDECNQLVSDYVPEIMQMVQDQVDPKMICGVLGFCQGGNKSLLPRMRLRNSPLFKAASKMSASTECDACKVVMSELRDLDRNKIIQEDLENVVKTKLCPVLGSLSTECLQTVEQYGQFLFEFLANELDPATRCQSLGFCSSDNTVRMTATRKATRLVKAKTVNPSNLQQSVQCVLCEFVMTKIDDLLEKNDSEAAIVNALDKVCSIMPDTIKEECDTFVKTYGPAIIDLLAQELDPQMICTSLGLCSTGKQMNTVKIQQKKVFKTTENCGICETIVQYVDSLLAENDTVHQIEAVVEKVCNFLPENLKKECDQFVVQYGPEIVQLVTKFADPKKVCQDLGMCSAGKVKTSTMELIRPAKAHLVGVNKCSYGPAYWCSSPDNAKRCGAVAHCEKHGWSKPQN